MSKMLEYIFESYCYYFHLFIRFLFFAGQVRPVKKARKSQRANKMFDRWEKKILNHTYYKFDRLRCPPEQNFGKTTRAPRHDLSTIVFININ